MRAPQILGLATIAILMVGTFAFALDLKVSIETDVRFAPEDEWALEFTEVEIDTEISGTLHDRLAYLVEPKLISRPIREEVDVSELQSRSGADPIVVELGEAYGELRELLIKNLDIKIGRQRIAWGTADKFNPTDNLNPDDLSDTLDFGEKIPSLGISARLYLGSFELALVWLPVFSPAALPPLTEALEAEFMEQIDIEPDTGSDVIDSLLSNMIDSDELESLDINQKSRLPKAKLANSTVGAKLSTMLLDFNMSASYVYGFDDIGTPETIEISLSEDWQPEITAYMGYPRLHIIGADLAGALSWLGDVGVWIEAAYFIPEPAKLRVLAHMPEEILDIARIAGAKVEGDALVITEEEVADKPYYKLTAGGDYTFKNGVYVNLQYVKGMPFENDPDMIGDYFVFNTDRGFMHDSIKMALFGLYSSNDGGWGLGPALEYYPFDGAEIDLMYFYPLGPEDSKLKQLSDSLFIINTKLTF